MIDQLQRYHTMLRSAGSSGYPNLSLFNPMHQQQPYPLAGMQQPLSNPYQRLPEMKYPWKQRTQQQAAGLRRYMTAAPWRQQAPRTFNNPPVWS